MRYNIQILCARCFKFGVLATLFDFCNEMRRKRNIDLYAGGMIISSQEAGYLLKTAEKVYFAVKNIIKKLL